MNQKEKIDREIDNTSALRLRLSGHDLSLSVYRFFLFMHKEYQQAWYFLKYIF